MSEAKKMQNSIQQKIGNLRRIINKYKLFSLIAFSGVSGSALLSSLADERQRERFVVEIRLLKQTQDSLRARNDYQRYQIENLAMARISVERCMEVFPKPAWRKEYIPSADVFVMDDLNLAYEAKYLFKISRAQYMGSLDKHAHGGEIAKTYEKYDRKALNADGEPIIEYASVRDKATGKLVFGKFMKWRKDIDGSTFIYGMELEILGFR
ncbi:MAG: hypothetical protein AAGF96_18810 [Bacteroidota bacterium]